MKKIVPYSILSLFGIFSAIMINKVTTLVGLPFLLLIFIFSFMMVGCMTKDSKSTIIKRIAKSYFLFMVGGSTYVLIELVYRARTHFSMYILGGLCFILIGLLNEVMNVSIITQMVFSAIIIVLLEYATGYIVNIQLGYNVWDYSEMPYNLHGQICLLFFNLWFLLSLAGIFIDDLLRSIVFKEKFPKYYL